MKGKRDVLGEKAGISNGSPGKTNFISALADEPAKQKVHLCGIASTVEAHAGGEAKKRMLAGKSNPVLNFAQGLARFSL